MFEDFQNVMDQVPQATDTGGYADIDKLFESTFQAPAAEGIRAGAVDQAEVANANAREAARKEQEDIKAKIQEMRDKNDPNKYQKVVNLEDGGYDFFDPSGNAISPIEYAKVTGKGIGDILNDSQRAGDIDFKDDYQALIDLNFYREQGTVDQFFEDYPDLKPAREDLLKLNNDQLLDMLFKQYPNAVDPSASAQERKTVEAGTNPIQKVLDLIPGVNIGRNQDTFLNTFRQGNRYD